MPSIFKQHSILSEQGSIRIPDRPLEYKEEKIFEEAEDFDQNGEVSQEWQGGANGYGENLESSRFIPTVMTREELAQHYKAELDVICQEATERAYADALVRKKGELSECLKQVEQQLDEMQKLQAEFVEKYAYQLKYLAIEIAEKMIFQKISQNDKTLERLILKNVSAAKNAAWMNVEVSDRLVDLVEHIKRELEKPEYHGRATITPVSAPIDTCRINTDEGTVVAGVSVQAENLREAYRIDERNGI